MRTLTGMGGLGNARELAEMLRQMGRGPDTMLAHITPDEAQMLLESGGSGRINPQTGLPEFQPEYNYDVEAQPGGFYGESEPIDYSQLDIGFGPGEFTPPTNRFGTMGMEGDQFERFTGEQPMFTGEGSLAPTGFQPFQYGPAPLQQEFVGQQPIPMVTAPAVERYDMGRGALPTAPVAAPPAPVAAAPTPQAAVTPEQEASFRQRYPVLSQALGTGIASLPAIYFSNRARREGRGAERELRAMAQPIREQAEALRQQALSGGLTPQQARQMEAQRARLRQSAAGRGATTGTQEAMIENTLGRQRADLAQTNLENAMRQLNLANTVTESAIRARLASDRDVDRYLTNIYTNLIRSSQGQRPAAMPTEQGGSILPEERLFTEPSARR